MVEVLDALVVASPGGDGAGYTYTYTLATRTGEILALLETRYGPRDASFNLLGIEFRDGQPGIWFPGDKGDVVVQLGTSAMCDETRALFQLAHECVHLLDPVLGGAASVLEEGVATAFALEYARRFQADYSCGDAKYEAATEMATQALDSSPRAILELRAAGGRFSDFSPETLVSACPGLDRRTADVLCSRYGVWDGRA
jgi:hypothetical protein